MIKGLKCSTCGKKVEDLGKTNYARDSKTRLILLIICRKCTEKYKAGKLRFIA